MTPPPPAWHRFLPRRWSPECWSLRYAADRLRAALYSFAHPGMPWLNAEANRLLLAHLPEMPRVLEFGSGRSTVFFARRAARLLSFESHPAWHRRVARRLPRPPDTQLQHLLLPASAWLTRLATESKAAFDVVLVDGERRADCVLAAWPLLTAGGLLILDNSNRYFPGEHPGPGSLRAWDRENPEHRQWQQIQALLAPYPQTRTSDGVTQTLFVWKRPAQPN